MTHFNRKMAIGLGIVGLVAVVVLMLINFGNQPPPFRPAYPTAPVRNDSIIKATVRVDMAWLNDKVRRAIPDPLAEETGRQITTAVNVAGELQVTRLVDVIIKEEYEDKVCSDAVNFFTGGVACLTYETVKKTRDITRKVEQTVMEQVSRVVDVDATVDYRIWPTNSAISIEGTKLAAVIDAEFRLRLNANLAGVAGDLLRVKLKGLTSCGHGEAPAKIRATVVGPLAVSPSGTGLTFTAESWKIDWLRRCSLTAVKVNVEDLLNLPGIKGEFKDAIDDAVKKDVSGDHDLKASLVDAWANISKPILISTRPEMWLFIHPINMYVENLRGTSQELLVDVGVRARPDLVVGRDVKPSTESFTSSPIVGNPGANIYLEATLDYDQAAQLLKSELSKRPIKNIDLRDFWVASDGSKIYVGCKIVRPAHGNIQMFGTPKWERDPLRLTLPDLDFVANAKSPVLNGLTPVARTVLRNWLRDNAVFSLQETRSAALIAATKKPLPFKGSTIGYVQLSDAKINPEYFILERDKLRLPIRVNANMDVVVGRQAIGVPSAARTISR